MPVLNPMKKEDYVEDVDAYFKRQNELGSGLVRRRHVKVEAVIDADTYSGTFMDVDIITQETDDTTLFYELIPRSYSRFAVGDLVQIEWRKTNIDEGRYYAVSSGSRLEVREGETLGFYSDDYGVTFGVPTLTEDTDYILPATDGNANDVLYTDGSEVLDWASLATLGATTFLKLDTSNDPLTGDLAIDNPGASSNSYALQLIADNASTAQTGEIETIYGADPYLRFSPPVGAGSATPTLDLHTTVMAFTNDNTTDIGASGANRPKDYYGSGNIDADGTITGGTLTDGTASLNGGNLTGMGNITGTDVDISAGTGDYTASGNVTLSGTGAFSSADADTTHYFGRAHIKPFSDTPYFGHRDVTAQGDLAIGQSTGGVTAASCAQSQTLRLNYHGYSRLWVGAGDVTAYDTFKIYDQQLYVVQPQTSPCEIYMQDRTNARTWGIHHDDGDGGGVYGANVFALRYYDGGWTNDYFNINPATKTVTVDNALVVGGAAAADADSSLDIQGAKAVMMPRLTAAQIAGLGGSNGLIAYDTTNNVFKVYQAGAWKTMQAT